MNSFSEPQSRAIRSVQNEDPKDEDPYESGKLLNFTSDIYCVYYKAPVCVCALMVIVIDTNVSQ